MNFIIHMDGGVTGDEDGALLRGQSSGRLSVGDVYVDRSAHPAEVYRWNGTEWILVHPPLVRVLEVPPRAG